jgi:hypothetical protein
VDFHGDGGKGDIDVVWTNRELGNGVEVMVGKETQEGEFIWNKHPLPEPSLSHAVALVGSEGFTPESVMGSSSVLSSLVGGELGHPVALPPRSVPDLDPVGNEPGLDEILAYLKPLSEFGDRAPGDIFFDEVVSVDVSPFSGHVYNLATSTNWYLANGIVAHNCHPWQRCPYEIAKWNALTGEISIANTSYALTEANFVGRFSKNHPLWVIDEADALEEELMRFIEFNVGKRLMDRLRLEPPAKKTVPESWKDWIRDTALPRFKRWCTPGTTVGR